MTNDMPYGDDAIRSASGKIWSEWREILDAWGAADKTHAEIARFVHEEHAVDEWWAQGVTVGYERMTGRRTVGQRTDGSYSASASKTFPVNAITLFHALVEDTQRDAWLIPGTLTVRTAKEPTSVRFDDNDDGGIVALWITDKGPEKSSVSAQLDKLSDKAHADERKAVWKLRLNDLAAYLKKA